MLKTTIIGEIGMSAKEVLGKSNNPFIAFSVASNSKDKEGNEQVTWVNVTCSFKHFEKTLPYLKKGRKIYIEGKPYAGAYAKNDEIVPTLNILAFEIQFLDSNRMDTKD